MHTANAPSDRCISGKSSFLFAPEELTPLAFAPVYRTLSQLQRQRYNQLHGFYFLEQTIFFEQMMGRPTLEMLTKFAPSREIENLIAHFISEENRHTGWFFDLLNQCEPLWYAGRKFHLLQAGRLGRALLGIVVRRPRLFPCLLWLQMITEERAQYFSTVFLKCGNELDPRFAEVQRKHLADEGGHIRWDAELIEWLWPATPFFLRKMNALLLHWLLREFFFLPKRSGWKVVEQLLAEFPELASRRSELRASMLGLARDVSYRRTLYPRSVFPRTRRLASRWKELRFLEQFFTD